MNKRIGPDPETGTSVQVDPSGLPWDDVSVPLDGEITEHPFGDFPKYKVAVRLENPPTYANMRVVHRLFVSTK